MTAHDYVVDIHFESHTLSITLGRDPACSPHERVRAYIEAANAIGQAAPIPNKVILCSLFKSDGWQISRGRVRTPSWIIDYPVDARYDDAPFYLKAMADSLAHTQAQYNFLVDKNQVYIVERPYSERALYGV
jgi:hypothetical protein